MMGRIESENSIVRLSDWKRGLPEKLKHAEKKFKFPKNLREKCETSANSEDFEMAPSPTDEQYFSASESTPKSERIRRKTDKHHKPTSGNVTVTFEKKSGEPQASNQQMAVKVKFRYLKTTKKNPNLAMRPNRPKSIPKTGQSYVGEILYIKSYMDILWQDGSLEKGVPSWKLGFCSDDLDEHIFLPGNFVQPPQEQCPVHSYGLVRSVNNAQRIATVAWYSFSPANLTGQLINVVDSSVLELHKHESMDFVPGLVVANVSGKCRTADNEHETGAVANVGQVESVNVESGKVQIRWADGQRTSQWPTELLPVFPPEDEDENGDDFEDDFEENGDWTDVDDNDDTFVDEIDEMKNKKSKKVGEDEEKASDGVLDETIRMETEPDLDEINTQKDRCFPPEDEDENGDDFEENGDWTDVDEDESGIVDEIDERKNKKSKKVREDDGKALDGALDETIRMETEPNLDESDKFQWLMELPLVFPLEDEDEKGDDFEDDFEENGDWTDADEDQSWIVDEIDERKNKKSKKVREDEEKASDGALDETIMMETEPDLDEGGSEMRLTVLEDVDATHSYAHVTFNGVDVNRRFLNAVRSELRLLRSALPPGIVVKTFENRMDLFSCMIVGPKGTPFCDALFFFDLHLPSGYPNEPPQVFYRSYSSKQLNPNLYQNGTVCLSLLGTWRGKASEVWNPGSNLLQVLVSIQGLILNSEPYFNEAGFESKATLAEFKETSRRYNESTLIRTLESLHAVVTQPPELFKEEVAAHARKSVVSSTLMWTLESFHAMVTQLPELFKKQIEVHLRKLVVRLVRTVQNFISGTAISDYPLTPVSEGFKSSAKRQLDKLLVDCSLEELD